MKTLIPSIVTLFVISVLVAVPVPAFAQSTERVLYSFKGGPDGAQPQTGLIFDTAGNFYGTTLVGGNPACYTGCGTIFELMPQAGGTWTEKVLHRFNGSDGGQPTGIIFDSARNNLYGTTGYGGVNDEGTVFELTRGTRGGWTEKILWSLDSTNGPWPSGLIFDSRGDLYGAAQGGGSVGYGLVFELIPQAGGKWAPKVLTTFDFADGATPGSITIDAAGNLYGATNEGGAGCLNYSFLCGTVFQLKRKASGWTEKVLHSFADPDGRGPNGLSPWMNANPILDTAGNLYGATTHGGYPNCNNNSGCGVVYELIHDNAGGWKEKVLHRFNSGDGSVPSAALIFDAGNLYGTTGDGGLYGFGTVFKLTPQADGSWTEKVLHSFQFDGKDGVFPLANLVLDPAGNLYGTTNGGGAQGQGTVFEITP
jgi:uncharacterized repeat protein (TIGR03803 family)